MKNTELGQYTAGRTRRLKIATPPARQSWRAYAIKIYNKLFEDEIFGRAAQLAYYWLFSFFPLLIFLTTMIAFLPMSGSLDRWLIGLSNILPAEAFSIVQKTFYEITEERRHGLLSFSFLIVIWASSSGMGAVITALNKAYDAVESRPWWQERLLAIVLTFGLAAFILAALLLVFFGDTISRKVAEVYGFGSTFKTLWYLAQWPLAIVFVLFGVELIYYFAPNRTQQWKLFTPGTIFALIFWLSISFALRLYVSNFGNYTSTYGALGGVIVLMIWLYLTGVGILVGGVINSVIRGEDLGEITEQTK